MAKTDFPLNIDRRRLLASAVAVRVASIMPGSGPADTAPAAVIQSSAMAMEAEPANFCAATARRLQLIAHRNAIRQEAGLPALSVVRELRRMKEQADREEFERFSAANGNTVGDEVLKRRREAEGNPNWQPNFLEGMSLQNQVRGILWEQFSGGPAGFGVT
jgi:mRNA-degrading endonuclease toxin of MazEF toxin-antitoxin module